MIFLKGSERALGPDGHNCPKENASGFDWPAISASCLLPSDLPCTGSTLYTYNVHSPSGDRCVMYKNECETNFRKKKRASPVCEHYSSPPPLLPCEVRQPAQPCTATTPPLLKPGTSLPGAQRSKALQFLGAGVETELCSSLQKCLGGVTFDLG